MLTPISKEQWNEILSVLKKDLSQPSYDTLTGNTDPIGINQEQLYISVPHGFAKDWLTSRYQQTILQASQTVFPDVLNITFVLQDDVEELMQAVENSTDTEKEIVSTVKASDQPHLNPKYTFEMFVVGNSNRFAHAAALAVADAPGKTYNPLFIYGGVGLGKTHLMQAIGHEVKIKHPGDKICYISSETFTNELIWSIREDKMVDFRNKYRNVDVLLIDDIHFLVNKERTQEEFFHTFNTLYEANKQIVLSSDRPPKEIPNLEKRLISRFEWGLITDLQLPDLETRIAILQKKARLNNIDLPNEVANLIASKIYSNIRELEGALVKLAAYVNLHHIDTIDQDVAYEALKDILPENKPLIVDPELIMKTTADYFHIKTEEIISKKRTREVAFPRQIAMYLCRELTDYSLLKIGEQFGGRDHTTVIHSIDKIKNSLKEDDQLKQVITELTMKIRNS